MSLDEREKSKENEGESYIKARWIEYTYTHVRACVRLGNRIGRREKTGPSESLLNYFPLH